MHTAHGLGRAWHCEEDVAWEAEGELRAEVEPGDGDCDGHGHGVLGPKETRG